MLALLPPIRAWVFKQNVLRGSRISRIYEKLLGNLLLIAYGFLILVPTVGGYLVLDAMVFRQQTFSLLLAGVAATTFAAVQLPKLLPPRVFVSMMPERNGAYIEKERTLRLTLQAGEEATAFFQLTNLGSNNYGDCTIWVDFEDKAFEPLQSPTGVDFAKRYIIHKQNKTAVFLPKQNFQDIPATNHLVLPVKFKCPNKKGEFRVWVGISTRDRWGESRVTLSLVLQ